MDWLMAATDPLATAVATTMKKKSAWVMMPSEAWTLESSRPATHTSTKPIRLWMTSMIICGQARRQMVRQGCCDISMSVISAGMVLREFLGS